MTKLFHFLNGQSLRTITLRRLASLLCSVHAIASYKSAANGIYAQQNEMETKRIAA